MSKSAIYMVLFGFKKKLFRLGDLPVKKFLKIGLFRQNF
jgi:hypothetical protein